MNKSQPNVLVTGGAGFLGNHVIQELLAPDSLIKPGILRSFDLRKSDLPIFTHVEQMVGDIRDTSAVEDACKDIDIVFHLAALVDWGTHPDDEVLEINVTGTQHLLEACKKQKVPILIYTSSLDAIYLGKSMVDIDEDVSYPERFPNVYCKSKAEAEKIVNAAHSSELQTISLRPADIYGPNDPFHIGTLIDMAKRKTYIRIGNGTAQSQHCYVGNVAIGHIQAAKAFLDGKQNHGGHSYFLTDGPPSNFFVFFDEIVEKAGYPIRPKNIWLPKTLTYILGSIAEGFAFLLRPIHRFNPKLSRFAVTYTCTDFTFTSKRAMQDFGFAPKYSHEEALEQTIAFYKD